MICTTDDRGSPALPQEFREKLRKKYLEECPEDEWRNEEEEAMRCSEAIMACLAGRYSRPDPLGVGGTAIVLRVLDCNLGVDRALKFPRPTREREDLFAQLVTSEVTQLIEAAHPNVVEVYWQESVERSGRQVPFYVMAFVKGARDASKYFGGGDRPTSDILSVLCQTMQGLAYLHSLDIAHLDVKLENMLVSEEGVAVISDLGSARNLKSGDEKTTVVFTSDYAHPAISRLATLSATADPNRQRGQIARADLRFEFDLYALGKNIFRILSFYHPTDQNALDSYRRKYLQLLACRLLDGEEIGEEERALGFPTVAFKEIKYTKLSQAITDIRKLTGEYDLFRLVPELDPHPDRTIQTSSLAQTPFTERVERVIAEPLFRRLAAVSQLGFISLTYPTASHTRFEHALGTFTNAARYCTALWTDPVNPLFRQLMNEEDISAVLLAALCHDIGQYPMAHDLEEADKGAFNHERLSLAILGGSDDTQWPSEFHDENFKKILESFRKAVESWGVGTERIANILRAKPGKPEGSIRDRALHTIIDGPIDADKVDYLVRDSVNLNVPFGRAIDFERLLQCLTMAFRPLDQTVYIALGIHEKGKIPAETVAFVRYAMFGSVYWHHGTRAVKAMLHRAVWEWILEGGANGIPRRRAVQQELDRFFALGRWTGQLRLPLGAKGRGHEDWDPSRVETQVGSTQLSPSDRDLLVWIWHQTSPAGRVLIQMIFERQLFKRLLVTSAGNNEELWTRLQELRDGRGGSKEVMNLQKRFQRRLVSEAERLKLKETGEMKKLHDDGLAIVLIDIPTERPGTDIDLEYLPESDWFQISDEWKEVIKLQDSNIWKDVQRGFMKSVGKSRVFCHPDFRYAVLKEIGWRRIEEILGEEVKKRGEA